MAIRILLYDDNEVIRSSIESLMANRQDIQLLAAMPNAETVAVDIAQLKPHVVLMDIDMPVVTGIQAVEAIRKVNEQLPIIMLTVFENDENIFEAVCAGASGYILKQHATEEIVPAIHNVLSGGAPMTGSVARKVLQMLPLSAKKEKKGTALSDKETRILQLLVNGHSYKMISAEIKVSIDTVRFHIKKIYDKLHVHSATEAVSKAIRQKLV